jgi:hypothetical protein
MFSELFDFKYHSCLLWVFVIGLFLNTANAQILYSISGTSLDAYSNVSNGNQISDATLSHSVYFKNPALLDSINFGLLNFTYSRQISNNIINAGYQIKNNKKLNTSVFIGSNSISDFIETDQIGNVIGKYGISSSQLGIILSKSQGNFKLGFSNRLIINSLAGIVRFGNLVDFGGQFVHPIKDLKFAFCINNVDLIVKKNQYNFPFEPLDINIGLSVKPKYMPVRIHWGVGRRLMGINKQNIDYNKNITNLGQYKGLIQTDILMHKSLSLLAGINLFSGFNGVVKKSISFGLVFMKDNFGFSVSNRKEFGLYNSLSFSLYIATK